MGTATDCDINLEYKKYHHAKRKTIKPTSKRLLKLVPVQRAIRQNVTNSLGYKHIEDRTVLPGLYGTFPETNSDLQKHLGLMDLKTGKVNNYQFLCGLAEAYKK